jgi:hypothetical protein
VRWTLPKEKQIGEGLIQVKQGSLRVEGVDFSIDLKNQNAANSPLILFELYQSDLHLVNCSVTVLSANRLPVTVVSLTGERPWNTKALGQPPEPLFVELRDSLVRAAQITVFVDSRQARISIENSIVSGPGSLMHVFHTRPLELDHHTLTVDIRKSVLNLDGPVLMVDCRPYDLKPVSLDSQIESSLILSLQGKRPPQPQIMWKSPVVTPTISTAIRWTGRDNRYFQRGDQLMAKTASGPVITLVQMLADWKRLDLGGEIGSQVNNRGRLPRNLSRHEQILPNDYKFAQKMIGIEINRIAKPKSSRRSSKR